MIMIVIILYTVDVIKKYDNKKYLNLFFIIINNFILKIFHI
jgi:hypothetical protein